MQFEYQNPTHLIFGGGSMARLGEIAASCGQRALLVTGGGSVKRSGVLSVRSTVSPQRVSPCLNVLAWNPTPGWHR